MSRRELPSCLIGAGMLGHTWLVTRLDKEGNECLLGEMSDGASAATFFDEEPSALRIFTRHRKSWKEVSRAMAVIS